MRIERQQVESGFPCPLCQVRPDVACRHRPASDWSMGEAPPDLDLRTARDREAHAREKLRRGTQP